MGETPDEVRAALRRPARRRLRHRHHHPVPAARRRATTRSSAGSSPRSSSSTRSVAEEHRLRRGAGRPAGPLVLPGGPALRADEAAPRRAAARRPGAPGRRRYRSAGGCLAPRALEYPDRHGREARQGGQGSAEGSEAREARRVASMRRKQLWQAFQIQRKEDKRLLPLMIGAFVLIVGAGVRHRAVLRAWQWMLLPLGVVLGALVAFIDLRPARAEVGLPQGRGPAGAAAWALDNLRGKWRVTPGSPPPRHFDAVHRVIGRPGVILVGEGAPHRVKPLLAQEKKRTAAAGRRHPDLRRHRRQRRGRGAAGEAGAAPDQAARATSRQADGRAGVAAGRAGLAGRPPRCPRARCRAGAKMRSVQRTVRAGADRSARAHHHGVAPRGPAVRGRRRR